jgi:hypothetical protein
MSVKKGGNASQSDLNAWPASDDLTFSPDKMPIESAFWGPMETGANPAVQIAECLKATVHWSATDDAENPYERKVGDALWTIRVNDFPAEPMYTLIVNGTLVGDFEDWPDCWIRPAPTPDRLPESATSASDS